MTTDNDRADAAPTGETVGYVRCLYGAEGDQPGDCDVAVYQGQQRYWLEDGDDSGRYESVGDPDGYDTLEAALEAARDYAEEQHEGLPGEDAEAMVARVRQEACERATPDGGWVVAWRDPDSGGLEAGRRYDSHADAEAEIEEWYEGVRMRTPGALVYLMRHPVLARVGDDSQLCEEEEDDDE